MKKFIYLVPALHIAFLAILALLITQASPAPTTQAISGIGIGTYRSDAGIAYISGRRLACSESSGETQCTMQIAGKPLEIRTLPSPPSDMNQLEGPCEASYDGKTWPCETGLRHVYTAGFAYLRDPLGLTPAQLATLRREYPIENLPERTIIVGIQAVTLLTALITALALIVWLQSQRKSGWAIAFTTAPVVAITLAATFIATIRLTSGLWD